MRGPQKSDPTFPPPPGLFHIHDRFFILKGMSHGGGNCQSQLAAASPPPATAPGLRYPTIWGIARSRSWSAILGHSPSFPGQHRPLWQAPPCQWLAG